MDYEIIQKKSLGIQIISNNVFNLNEFQKKNRDTLKVESNTLNDSGVKITIIYSLYFYLLNLYLCIKSPQCMRTIEFILSFFKHFQQIIVNAKYELVLIKMLSFRVKNLTLKSWI